MPDYINIILLIILGFAALFMIRKMLTHQKPKHIVPKDPASQDLYEQQKHQGDEEIILSMEEKIELSWEFLLGIVRKIITIFSPEDKEQLHQAGGVLNKNGMQYQHDVNQEVIMMDNLSKVSGVQKQKNDSDGRSR
ncbi:MAG: hypothetical protein COA94_08185 [Rickettsiales bacterium]|nr:MAG: hypothetical protein COA94_08185 [Rickettsiales bacterium]